MKPAWQILFGLVLMAMLLPGCREKASRLDPDLARFIATKQQQAHSLAQSQAAKLPPEVDKLFTALLSDDWQSATNSFTQLEKLRTSPPALPNLLQKAKDWVVACLQEVGFLRDSGRSWAGPPWEPIREAYWMYVLSKTWQKPHLQAIVHDITATNGMNSIYFGGSDPGRFAVTAAMASHQQGRPSFVLTQNCLTDGNYLDYLRSMFSNHIYVPTQADSQAAYETYVMDAKRRSQAGRLKKEEKVFVAADGSVSVGGEVAVIEMISLLSKVIFDQNTNREIYLEQSYPLPWTYPHLVPAGPIFKINREPLLDLPDSILQANRAYWSNQCAALIGDWITEKTTVREVCDFAERVYVRHDFSGFRGDMQFLLDHPAQEYVSALRYWTADLYLRRSRVAPDLAQQQRMQNEARLAFQQAFALGPCNHDAAHDFSEMLAQSNRFEDAERLVRVSAMVNPTNASILDCINEIKSAAVKAP